MNLINNLVGSMKCSLTVKLLCVLILADCTFGIVRAIKERKLNSTIGIDGMIRKSAMLLSVIFMTAIDYIIQFNLIGFVPESLRNDIKLDYVGFNDLFNILYIIFEYLSVLKNMIKCKLPIPKKLQVYLEDVLRKWTDEI